MLLLLLLLKTQTYNFNDKMSCLNQISQCVFVCSCVVVVAFVVCSALRTRRRRKEVLEYIGRGARDTHIHTSRPLWHTHTHTQAMKMSSPTIVVDKALVPTTTLQIENNMQTHRKRLRAIAKMQTLIKIPPFAKIFVVVVVVIEIRFGLFLDIVIYLPNWQEMFLIKR